MAALTILDALKGLTAYPIPLRALAEIAEGRGVALHEEATEEALSGKAYNLAKADVFLWLFSAPNITQGGQSYSFSDAQRTEFKNRAHRLFSEYDTGNAATKPIYGYKGTRL